MTTLDLPPPFAFQVGQTVKTATGEVGEVKTQHSEWTVYVQYGSKAAFFSTVGMTAVESAP
jgi:hypothetical protein